MWWPARTEVWWAVSSDIALRLERGDSTTLREAAQVAGQAVFAANMSLGGIHCAPLGDDLLWAAREIGKQAFARQREEPGLRRDEAWDRAIAKGEWSEALRRLTPPAACITPTSAERTRSRGDPTFTFHVRTQVQSHSIGWCEVTRPR